MAVAGVLRQDAVRYEAQQTLQGLYVVERYNTADSTIPRLPRLLEEGAGAFTLEDNPDGGNLYCPQLREHFQRGDIVRLDPKACKVRTIISGKSNANTLLVTEQCDNRCLFCSQPPKSIDDAVRYSEAALAILNYGGDQFIGISGGEPTLNRVAFLRFLQILQHLNNRTPLHILTNGRSLRDRDYMARVAAAVNGRDVLWGVPFYGFESGLHDALVAAAGAFQDSVRGVINLLAYGQAVEIRVIPIRQNYQFLPDILRFIVDAFPRIVSLSVMNLEPIGWARPRYDTLSVPVGEQHPYLVDALAPLADGAISFNLFNYPLCLLEPKLRPYARQSISDWKNYFPPECGPCRLKSRCAGFFTSATEKFLERPKPLI